MRAWRGCLRPGAVAVAGAAGVPDGAGAGAGTQRQSHASGAGDERVAQAARHRSEGGRAGRGGQGRAGAVRAAARSARTGSALRPAAGGCRAGAVVGCRRGDPFGLLARVTAVSATPAGTLLQTVPATLPEVVSSGQLDLDLRPPTFRRAATTDGPLGASVQCAGGARLAASAAASVRAGVSLRAGWSFPLSITARFAGTVTASARVAASISGQPGADPAAACTGAAGDLQLPDRPRPDRRDTDAAAVSVGQRQRAGRDVHQR